MTLAYAGQPINGPTLAFAVEDEGNHDTWLLTHGTFGCVQFTAAVERREVTA